MIKIFLRAIVVALALAWLAPGARAADPMPFSDEAFATAQAAGKPILINIWAAWCPVCQVQDPILYRLIETPAFADMVMLEIEFDKQIDLVRRFGARQQSTLIVYRGRTERARSVGETRQSALEALLAKAKD